MNDESVAQQFVTVQAEDDTGQTRAKLDVRELQLMANEHLPEHVAADLGLASTAYAWFKRLADHVQ